ncbi:MAG TPA: hypothetical protein VF117_04015 [Gammaproteobacteria bacterium]
MSPTRKPPGPELDDIPLLEDVVEHDSVAAATDTGAVVVPMPQPETETPSAAVETIPLDILSEVLTERITALTDRLLRDASAEIHATLVNKVWEKLRDEIPALVDAALRENGGDT